MVKEKDTALVKLVEGSTLINFPPNHVTLGGLKLNLSRTVFFKMSKYLSDNYIMRQLA